MAFGDFQSLRGHPGKETLRSLPRQISCFPLRNHIQWEGKWKEKWKEREREERKRKKKRKKEGGREGGRKNVLMFSYNQSFHIRKNGVTLKCISNWAVLGPAFNFSSHIFLPGLQPCFVKSVVKKRFTVNALWLDHISGCYSPRHYRHENPCTAEWSVGAA